MNPHVDTASSLGPHCCLGTVWEHSGVQERKVLSFFLFFPPLPPSPGCKYTAHSLLFHILLHSLFLFWMEENIKLKFLYEENNCLWQAVYQSVWQYLLSAILYSWKKASLALCLETAGIYTHLDSKTPPALLPPAKLRCWEESLGTIQLFVQLI